MATVAGSLVQIARSPSIQGSDSFEGANRFALLSDTHIAMDPKDENRGFKPATNLQVVVQQVCDGQYESAFLNGDAARLEGKQEDYDHLKKLLAPMAERCPVAIGLGNHDDRDTFKKVFETKETPEAKEASRHVTVVDSHFVRWILLDSLLFVNKTPGHLGKQQRTWLRNYLASAGNKPTLIMVHHTLGDNDGELLDARELLEIAKGAPAVKGIFYGHSHKYEFKRDGKLHLINLPLRWLQLRRYGTGRLDGSRQPRKWHSIDIASYRGGSIEER